MRHRLSLAALAVMACLVVIGIRCGNDRSDKQSGVHQAELHPEQKNPHDTQEYPPQDTGNGERTSQSSPAKAQGEAYEEAKLTVTVQYKDDGDPRAGESVELCVGQIGAAKCSEIGTTDAKGQVSFLVSSNNEYDIALCNEPSVASRIAKLQPGEVRNVLLVVASEPKTVMCGELRDAVAGHPIIGVVRLLPSRLGQAKALSVDRSGQFVIRARASEYAFAQCEADGYGPSLFKIMGGHETRDRRLIVMLYPVASLAVIVTRSGALEHGLRVALSTDTYRLQFGGGDLYYSKSPSWSAATDDNGEAVFGALPSLVPLELTVQSGHVDVFEVSTAIVLEPGEERRVEIDMSATGTVVGRVEDINGRAVAGLKIMLVRSRMRVPTVIYADEEAVDSAITDEAGYFELRRVPLGKWLVGPPMPRQGQPASMEGALVGLANAVCIEEDPEESRLVLQVGRGLSISGVVLGPDGEIIEGCPVVADALGALAVFRDTTSANGYFEIGPLAPGAYRVQAGQVGSSNAPSEAIQAIPGESLELRLTQGGRIRALIMDAGGEAQSADCVISWKQDSDGWLPMISTDGTLECQGLPLGICTVSARTMSGLCGQEQLRVMSSAEDGGSHAIVRVTPGVQLKLHQGSEEQVVNASILLRGHLYWSGGIEKDMEVTVAVPVGEIDVQWEGRDGLVVERLTVKNGQENAAILK